MNIDRSFSAFFQIFESQYRLEYSSLKQWTDLQQQFERIFTKISKDFDQFSQAHSLFQLEEYTENLTVNTNQQEHIENLFREARRMLDSLEQSNQKNLTRSIEQYEIRWKELRERLKRKLEETSKFHSEGERADECVCVCGFVETVRNQTMNFIQECEGHAKKCVQFMTALAEIQKDSTKTSIQKLEQLKVGLSLRNVECFISRIFSFSRLNRAKLFNR